MRMMRAAGSFAAFRGVHEIRLTVLDANLGARAFYARLGFRDYTRALTKRIRPD